MQNKWSKGMSACAATAGALVAGLLCASGAAQAGMLEDKNCMSCHARAHKVVGPSFNDIRAKYSSGADLEALAQRIVNGSSGVWGPVPMPANSHVSMHEARTMLILIGVQTGGPSPSAQTPPSQQSSGGYGGSTGGAGGGIGLGSSSGGSPSGQQQGAGGVGLPGTQKQYPPVPDVWGSNQGSGTAGSRSNRNAQMPAEDATRCLSTDKSIAGSFGRFNNACDYKVNYTFCNLNAPESSWASSFNCLKKYGTGGGTVGPRGSSGSHIKGAPITYFVGCKYPAYPKVQYETGRGLVGQCK